MGSIEKEALTELADGIRTILGEMLVRVLLFGSFVRGEYSEESDIDILIIVRRKDSEAIDAVYDLAVDLQLRYDTLFSLLFVTEKQHDTWKEWESPFIESVEREGVPL